MVENYSDIGTLNVLLSFAQFEREVTTERIRQKNNVYDGNHSPIIKPEHFDKIQSLLQQQSRKPRGKLNSTHSSPYAGKLYDETGDHLTPSHSSKKGIRHRYYVSRRLIEGTTSKNLAGEDGLLALQLLQNLHGWRMLHNLQINRALASFPNRTPIKMRFSSDIHRQ